MNANTAPDCIQRANALAQQGYLDQAVENYRRALALEPGNLEAQNNLGNVLAQQGRLGDAAECFRRVIAVRPDLAGVHFNLGKVLRRQDRLEDAVASYERALVLKPDYAEAHDNLGNALVLLDRAKEAVAAHRRAIALKPDFADAYLRLGVALCADHRIAEGFAAYTRYAERSYGRAGNPTAEEPSAHRLRHDQEQSAFLASMGVPGSGKPIGGMFHLGDGARITGPAVNPDNAIAEIESQWRESAAPIVVIDNLLTEEALAKLHRFAAESTVWRKSYRNGYLAALSEYGFACPLLAQIADELRAIYPAIFRAHALRYLWGFKYDSAMSGTELHADNAAVNVNFWITSDEANKDPEHGGLIVWDKAAPLDWDYAKFNGNQVAIRDFLNRSGARPITVPYRCNRAVIFDSDLFHETDTINFSDGYLNRRINVTLLYGKRDAEAK